MSSGTEYELVLSEKAKRDIRLILRKTGEQWGEKQIPIYAGKLDTALETLRLHPTLGHTSNRLPKTRRVYPVGSHVVFYRIQGKVVRVDRILHERMNPSKSVTTTSLQQPVGRHTSGNKRLEAEG
jgi:toxin ParE1/3/4